MPNLKLSDAMFTTAEAVSKMAKQSGVKLDISTLYSPKNAKSLAVVSAIMKNLISEATSCGEIEVTND